MRHSLLLCVVIIGIMNLAGRTYAEETGINQNELMAAKAALTSALSHQEQVEQSVAAGTATSTDKGKAALNVEQAKLKLAIVGRVDADAVVSMKRSFRSNRIRRLSSRSWRIVASTPPSM